MSVRILRAVTRVTGISRSAGRCRCPSLAEEPLNSQMSIFVSGVVLQESRPYSQVQNIQEESDLKLKLDGTLSPLAAPH